MSPKMIGKYFYIQEPVSEYGHMKRIVYIGLLAAILYAAPYPVLAVYVLPYPSYMPGNKMYRITRLIDRLKAPLYFGNLSSYRYHLSLSDKYLVEAKTLFEYKQYLLAVDALRRSDKEFSYTLEFLVRAKNQGKDIGIFQSQYIEACDEHKRILTSLISTLPESFEWSPEKTAPTTLPFKTMLSASITRREKCMLRMN